MKKQPAFDWTAHNAELDKALAEWNRAERELSELHTRTARELARLVKELRR